MNSSVSISEAAHNAAVRLAELPVGCFSCERAAIVQSAIDSETAALRGDSLKLKTLAPMLADCESALKRVEQERAALLTEAKELRKMVFVFAGGMTLDEYEREAKRHGGFVSVSVGIGVYREAAAILARYPARD